MFWYGKSAPLAEKLHEPNRRVIIDIAGRHADECLIENLLTRMTIFLGRSQVLLIIGRGVAAVYRTLEKTGTQPGKAEFRMRGRPNPPWSKPGCG
jgi:hypothetical protein